MLSLESRGMRSGSPCDSFYSVGLALGETEGQTPGAG